MTKPCDPDCCLHSYYGERIERAADEIERLRKENIAVSCHCAELIEKINQLHTINNHLKAGLIRLIAMDKTTDYSLAALNGVRAALEQKPTDKKQMTQSDMRLALGELPPFSWVVRGRDAHRTEWIEDARGVKILETCDHSYGIASDIVEIMNELAARLLQS